MLEVFYTTPSVWTKCAFFPVFLLPTECPLCCFFMTVSIHTSTISFTKRSRCPSVQISPEPSAFPVIKTILTIVNIKEWQTLHKWLLLQKPRPWGFSMNQMRGLKYLIISNAFKTMALASSIFSRSNRFRNAFGSKQTTLKDAREKDSSIKMSDVEEFFRKNVEVNAKPRGYNSLVAPNNNHTYQVDLFFMGYYDFDEEQKNQRRTCSHWCFKQVCGCNTN